jgi:hypothetical protein
MMHREFLFLRHLELLKTIYLFGQSDIVSTFIGQIFHDNLQQTTKESSISYLQN